MYCPQIKSLNVMLRSFCLSYRLLFNNKVTRFPFRRSYAQVKVKNDAKKFALNHFDQFYGSTFDNWPSIRLGILCPQSYCAIVNTFCESDQITETLNNLGAYDMRLHYDKKYQEYESLKAKGCLHNINEKTSEYQYMSEVKNYPDDKYFLDKADPSSFSESEDFVPATKIKDNKKRDTEDDFSKFYEPNANFNIKIIQESAIQLPVHWKIFFFPRGCFKDFPPPKQDPSGLLNYYLMNGSSILPVLALNVKKGDDVGDLCASPGGKSLAILFGLKCKQLICNDSSSSRLHKLKTALYLYVPKMSEWNSRILISKFDVCSWNQVDMFDKILLDVPCTNDRLSVTTDGNNIFKASRFNERMKLPQLQTQMLSSALKALKPNGSLVYSTCSLSPIQNDGVVYMALSKLSTESTNEFVVKNLSELFFPVQDMYSFSACKYGHLVAPYLPLNYGPMYISKIQRIK